MKPILFNTEMVKAILDGRKTATRRLVKPQPDGDGSKPEPLATRPCYWNSWGDDNVYRQPYHPGDILYVREAWQQAYDGSYVYRAGHKYETHKGWRPSIHMPKEAARLFLRVKEVRVERLHDIDYEGCKKEGIWDSCKILSSNEYNAILVGAVYPVFFAELWDNTIEKADLPHSGWNANPWVWVIEFERVSKEEAVN